MFIRSTFTKFLTGLVLLVVPVLSIAQGNFPGAVYTSLASGETVNQNIYTNKKDVYLNGGPQNLNAAGLPGGYYYFQVTDPSGQVLLSSDRACNRQVWVDPAEGVIHGAGEGIPCIGPPPIKLHKDGDHNVDNHSIPVQLYPYDDTPNNGGEYKVWLIRQRDDLGNIIAWVDPNDSTGRSLVFQNNGVKTDNFKVFSSGGGKPGDTILQGFKFFDADGDGIFDVDEVTLEGFRINVFYDDPDDDPDLGWILYDPDGLGYTTVTDADGFWTVSTDILNEKMFKVCEVLPETGDDCSWYQTSPDPGVGGENAGCWVGTAPKKGGLLGGLDFGNICLCPLTGGHTRGYWHNKNGEARFTEADRLAMNALCLRNQDGEDTDFANHAEFSSYLVGAEGANGHNMANMLSAQLAALILNVRHYGDVDFNEDLNENTVVFLGDVAGLAECWNAFFVAEGADFETLVTVGDLIDIASAMICDAALEDGNGDMWILANHPDRAKFDCIKTIIDSINNNLLGSTEGTICPIIYP